jgi:hypothetical protein
VAAVARQRLAITATVTALSGLMPLILFQAALYSGMPTKAMYRKI